MASQRTRYCVYCRKEKADNEMTKVTTNPEQLEKWKKSLGEKFQNNLINWEYERLVICLSHFNLPKGQTKRGRYDVPVPDRENEEEAEAEEAEDVEMEEEVEEPQVGEERREEDQNGEDDGGLDMLNDVEEEETGDMEIVEMAEEVEVEEPQIEEKVAQQMRFCVYCNKKKAENEMTNFTKNPAQLEKWKNSLGEKFQNNLKNWKYKHLVICRSHFNLPKGQKRGRYDVPVPDLENEETGRAEEPEDVEMAEEVPVEEPQVEEVVREEKREEDQDGEADGGLAMLNEVGRQEEAGDIEIVEMAKEVEELIEREEKGEEDPNGEADGGLAMLNEVDRQEEAGYMEVREVVEAVEAEKVAEEAEEDLPIAQKLEKLLAQKLNQEGVMLREERRESDDGPGVLNGVEIEEEAEDMEVREVVKTVEAEEVAEEAKEDLPISQKLERILAQKLNQEGVILREEHEKGAHGLAILIEVERQEEEAEDMEVEEVVKTVEAEENAEEAEEDLSISQKLENILAQNLDFFGYKFDSEKKTIAKKSEVLQQ